MIFLFGSIILVSYLILAFKVLQKLRLQAFQTIVFNYITCFCTGAIINGSIPFNNDNLNANWFTWACIMGRMFIVTFNIVGITAQRISVSVASIAYRLSLIIPVVFSIYLYNESLQLLQWIGIVLALFAVLLTCWPNKLTEAKNKNSQVLLYILPVILFFGSGVLDISVKYVEQAFLNDTNKNAFLSTAFASAATIGLFALIIQIARRKRKIDWRNILAGVCIGVPNYFSIWCLIKFFQVSPMQSSAIIPINNLGIVLLSTVVAWIFFKEDLSKTNWAGIFLSTIAIILIAFGDKL